MALQYLTYQQIDKNKWDECIRKAPNGLVYGYSFYLDAMAKQWDGIVLSAGPDPGNDYEAVMPLTWNKKYSITYLYQPPFTASLGVFGNNISAQLVNEFLSSIPAKFRYWDIYLNPGNFFSLPGLGSYQRMNYVLPLNKSYESIVEQYRENIQRNIKKSERSGNITKKNIDLDAVIELAKEQARHFADISEKEFAQFKQLCETLYKKEMLATYGIYTATGELIASGIFFFSHNRAYYILPGNHPNGKTLGASHALIDAFIKDHARQNILLDFEGSDISSLAFFYSSFGAIEEKYSGIKLNRLPGLVKWMKK